jgi:hypothetical protein
MDDPKKKALFFFCVLTLLLCACTEVPEHCGDRFPALNPSAQFCYQGRLENKCGGQKYDLSTQGCYDNVIRSDVNKLKIVINGRGSVLRDKNETNYKWATDVTLTPKPDIGGGWFNRYHEDKNGRRQDGNGRVQTFQFY